MAFELSFAHRRYRSPGRMVVESDDLNVAKGRAWQQAERDGNSYRVGIHDAKSREFIAYGEVYSGTSADWYTPDEYKQHVAVLVRINKGWGLL